ncbi:inorganic diphosphatase [Bradyrhizobium tropiciagri]|uniref:inorganic diphosphatase n=1 Tax=Bradyrhizobium tropiciagri TaxID=312253 RepID=UPI0032219FAC
MGFRSLDKKADNGDPLDVLIIHDSQTYPGVVLPCRPIGILEILQTRKGRKERIDRAFAAPDRSPLETNLKDIRHLPRRGGARAVLSGELKFLGWRGPGGAVRAIKRLSVRSAWCAHGFARVGSLPPRPAASYSEEVVGAGTPFGALH